MMEIPSIEDVKKFLWTLVLGEFEDNKQQSSIAIMMRGLIGVIPGIDQVLDAQDTIGLIIRFKNKNWQLDKDDYADAAFTAFGWIPEIGSVFKGILKPIWRSSRSGSMGVRNGIQMLERALGSKHGAFISKMRSYVNNGQRWTQITASAVISCREAISAYLEMLQIIARGSITLKPVNDWRWTHITITLPNSLVTLAREQIPPTQRFLKEVDNIIQQGSETVREFLQELLGEHAVWVETTVKVVALYPHPNSRGQITEITAQKRIQEKNNQQSKTLKKEQPPKLQQGQRAQNATTNMGRTALLVQRTGELTGNALTGIIGEHMADYWMAKKLGLNISHDHGHNSKEKSNNGCYKINHHGKLCQLHVSSPNPKGIDSLWKVNNKIGGKPYCIVEAKASATAPNKSLSSLLTDGRDADKRGTSKNQHQLQMSSEWCNERLKEISPGLIGKYSRLVVFFNAKTIAEHLAAYTELMTMLADNKKQSEIRSIMKKHQTHEPSRIFTEQHIESLVCKRTGSGNNKNSTKNRSRSANK